MTEDKQIRCIFARELNYGEKLVKIEALQNLDIYSSYVESHTHNTKTYKHARSYQDNSIETISIMVRKKNQQQYKRRKKHKVLKYQQNIPYVTCSFNSSDIPVHSRANRYYSMPDLKSNEFNMANTKQAKSSDIIVTKQYHPYNTNFIVNNCCHTCDKPECLNPFLNPCVRTRIYRCQLNTQEESCCCSCNSDAMFEVMKSLYDCYKKKNCDHCNCILCGHLPVVERRFGETRKSGVEMTAVGVETASAKERRKDKLAQAKAAGLLASFEGKTHEEKEKIMRELAKADLPLPEAKTASEKELSQRIRTEFGLPPEPKTAAEWEKYKKAEAAGVIASLEGKSSSQKEKILRKQAQLGITLPEGRTSSEKALIQKIKSASGAAPDKIPSEKLAKAKAEGLLTPLQGKTLDQKEKIVRGLAMKRLPLPEARTDSEKKLIDKIRKDLGLPPEPKSATAIDQYQKALIAGLITPLEGKSSAQKEKILRAQAEAGLPLPEGRSASEKALIDKIKATSKIKSQIDHRIPSEKMRKAKAEGLLTPLEGKTPEQKEKILRGLAKSGLGLPEGKTQSEKKLIQQVRKDMGLPPSPKTPSEKIRMTKALASGIVTPLEGKTPAQREKILRSLAEAGIALPEGRTPSEKALIDKIKVSAPKLPSVKVPSEKIRQAKAAGLLTPLEGKTLEQKTKILKGLAMHGIPLPEGKTASEQKLIDKIRTDVGLPPEPKSGADKRKFKKALAAGLITPLEGKSATEKEKILRAQAAAGLVLPEGRTQSEKALIDKVKATTKVRPSSKAGSSISPLEGKSPSQIEKMLKSMADAGIALPDGRTPSERAIISKVKAASPGPPGIQVSSEKIRKAMAAGLLTPLEGKSLAQKEKILRGKAEMGLPLPEGRTASEKALIAKIKATTKPRPSAVAPETRISPSKASGEKVGRSSLPPDQAKKLDEKTAKVMKEGKGPVDECICGLLTPESQRARISKVIAPSSPPPARITSEKLRAAKAAGLLTPLQGKTPEQKEKIIRGLAKQGLPLPEAKTTSEKKLVDKIRAEMGLPPEPKSPSIKQRYAKAQAAGYITPLEGKSPSQKEQILKGQAEMGLPLPEGRTPSEKALIAKVKAGAVPRTSLEGRAPSEKKAQSEKMRKAKAEGLLTPLEGKTQEQKEKIIRGLAKQGLPLPETKTTSEKILVDKIRAEMGLPPEPKSPSIKQRYAKAQAAGYITPLVGKSPSQKEKILKGLAEMGLPLPEGRTPSEKALIAKVKAEAVPRTSLEGRALSEKKAQSEKMRKAKAEGLLTPLEGKTQEQKEKIIRGLAKQGLPLPETKTTSEKKLVDKIRAEMGLPPEPKSPSIKQRYAKAQAAGYITPLEGKSPSQKEKILKGLAEMGLPLPEGRTPSEKALIAKVKAGAVSRTSLEGRALSEKKAQSEKMRKAKAEGLLTPLEGKTQEQKEKIIKGLAKSGLPLPEGKTPSEKNMIQKIRGELGLPPEPKTPSQKLRMSKALAAGIITPLEGKTPAQKEKILKSMADANVPLPEGRTPSEKALIAKVKAQATPSIKVPSEKLRKAKAAGLLTPLEGKTPEQKEKILRGLAAHGIPFPVAKSPEDKALLDKVRKETGLPPEPDTPSLKEKYKKARIDGIITPLEGKTPAEKERALKRMHEAGIPLPEGRTASEKSLIRKVKATPTVSSGKVRSAKAPGTSTPLEGKTHEQKEKILRALAQAGAPMPEGKTASERSLIKKIKGETTQPRASRPGLIGPPALPPTEAAKLDKRTAKGMKESKGPSDECICGLLTPESERERVKGRLPSGAPKAILPSKAKIPSEKLRKAKADGLLTPLEGKPSEEKERIVRGLAKSGMPLPEGKTPSEKRMIDKVRTEMGLPPEPKTPAEREKIARGLAAGIVTPLEGKTAAQKEKILKSMADAGISLPVGRTPSEKMLIAKVKRSAGAPSPIPSEKLKKAKADGLLTPLEGKTPEQKEKILKGLLDYGLPLPEGKTKSDKDLIKKLRVAAGLPPTPTPSETRKVKSKSIGVGVGASKKIAKGMGSAKLKGGLVEEFEDVVRTNTCDRGCGCDKKKIRFKHCYVKIRVTSPDLSSICPCPDDCIPGVKSGVVVDNEGIKVTCGAAIGVPSLIQPFTKNSFDSDSSGISSYISVYSARNDYSTAVEDTSLQNIYGIYKCGTTSTIGDELEFVVQCTESYTTYSEKNQTDNTTNYENTSTSIFSIYRRSRVEINRMETEDVNHYSEKYPNTFEVGRDEVYANEVSLFSLLEVESSTSKISTGTSYESIILLTTESSLSLSSKSYESELCSLSAISFLGSNYSSSNFSSQNNKYNHSVENYEYLNNIYDNKAKENTVSTVNQCYFNQEARLQNSKRDLTVNTIFRTKKKQKNRKKNMEEDNDPNVTDKPDTLAREPIVVINELNNNISPDIVKMVNDILSRKPISDTSSVFVLVSSEGHETDCSLDLYGSTLALQLSQEFSDLDHSACDSTPKYDFDAEWNDIPKKLFPSARGIKVSKKGKKSNDTQALEKLAMNQKQYLEEVIVEKRCRIVAPLSETNIGNKPVTCNVETDTMADRPCCCQIPDEHTNIGSKDRCVATLKSSPMIQRSQDRGGVAWKTRTQNQKAKCAETDTTTDRPCCCQAPERSDVTSILPNFGSTDHFIATTLCRDVRGEQGGQSCRGDSSRVKKNHPNSKRCSPNCRGKESTKNLLRRKASPGLNRGSSVNFASSVMQKAPQVSAKEYSKKIQQQKHSPNKPCRPCSHPFFSRVSSSSMTKGPRLVPLHTFAPDYAQEKINEFKEKIYERYKMQGLEQQMPNAGQPQIGRKRFPHSGVPCFRPKPPPQGTGDQGRRGVILVVGGEDPNMNSKGPCNADSNLNLRQKNACCQCKRGKTNINKTCICQSINEIAKLLNRECECQPEPCPPCEESESFESVTSRDVFKFKSEMTQTTSGFKVSKRGKQQVDEEMSFEDALKYFGEGSDYDLHSQGCYHYVPGVETKEGPHSGCTCEDKTTLERLTTCGVPKQVVCECPYEEPPPPLPPPPCTPFDVDEGFKGAGIKFTVGGKGTASQGLSGICCFDLIQGSSDEMPHSKSSESSISSTSL